VPREGQPFRRRRRQHTLDQDAIVGGQSNLLRDIGAYSQGRNVERRPADAAILGEVGDYCLRGIDGIANPMPDD